MARLDREGTSRALQRDAGDPCELESELPYYSAYGQKKVNLTERMRAAKENMDEADDGGIKTRTEGHQRP